MHERFVSFDMLRCTISPAPCWIVSYGMSHSKSEVYVDSKTGGSILKLGMVSIWT